MGFSAAVWANVPPPIIHVAFDLLPELLVSPSQIIRKISAESSARGTSERDPVPAGLAITAKSLDGEHRGCSIWRCSACKVLGHNERACTLQKVVCQKLSDHGGAQFTPVN